MILPNQVRYQRRKSIGLYLLDQGGYEVRAPKGTPKRVVDAFISQHQNWLEPRIKEQTLKISHAQQKWVCGAEHYFKGKLITLNVQASPSDRFYFNGQVLQLHLSGPITPEKTEHAVTEWLRHEAKLHLEARVNYFIQAPIFYGLETPSVKVRKMKTRWGSCSSKGNVNFNLWLMHYDTDCIDYVVVHELCHLLEFNHSPRFYELVASILPHWQASERRLESNQYSN